MQVLNNLFNQNIAISDDLLAAVEKNNAINVFDGSGTSTLGKFLRADCNRLESGLKGALFNFKRGR